MPAPMQRFSNEKISIESIISLIGTGVRADILGQSVKINSNRLLCFKQHGTTCSACGMEAQYFVLERHAHDKDAPYHAALYGLDEKGKEVLFTHDHTLSRSNGGKDSLSNMTTMCGPCNWKKGAIECTHIVPHPTKKLLKPEPVKRVVSKQIPSKPRRLPTRIADLDIRTERTTTNYPKISLSWVENEFLVKFTGKETAEEMDAYIAGVRQFIRTFGDVKIVEMHHGRMGITDEGFVMISARHMNASESTSMKCTCFLNPESKVKSFWKSLKKVFTFQKKDVE